MNKRKWMVFPLLAAMCAGVMSGCATGGGTTVSTISKASTEPMNKIIQAKDVKESARPMSTVCESWKDENNNFYYVIYLGKIELAEIYNIESFYYANDFDEMTLTEENITVESVTKTYRNTITSTVSWETKTYIKDTLELGVEATYGPFSASAKNSFETGIEEKHGVEYVEENESIYTSVVTRTKRVMKEKKINFKRACTAGKYYRYSMCADIDCYMNLFVPSNGGEATYQVYSEFDPSRAFVMLMESDSHNDFWANDTFDLSDVDKSLLGTPTEFRDSHPPITMNDKKIGTTTVSYNFGGIKAVPFDITEIYNQAVKIGGYNKLTAKVTFSSDSDSVNWLLGPNSEADGHLGYCTDGELCFAYAKWKAKDDRITIEGWKELDYFAAEKKVYVLLRVLTPTTAFDFSNIEISISITR